MKYLDHCKIDSSLSTFCGMLEESLEHLFVTCHFTKLLWKELKAWCNGRQIIVESLSAVNIIFGDWQRKDCFLLLNHIITTPTTDPALPKKEQCRFFVPAGNQTQGLPTQLQ